MAFDAVITFFQTGGGFMYPIALVFIIGIVIAVERWVFISSASRSNNKAMGPIIDALDKHEHAKVLKVTQSSKTFVSSIVHKCLLKSKGCKERADIESIIEEGLMEVSPRLQKRTQYLATLANVATLLGLLGTIIGLIAAFTAVASADPAQKATLLSQSISVAMNTTAFGLMTAIPLLLVHSLLQSKATRVLESLQVVGIKCVNSLRYEQS